MNWFKKSQAIMEPPAINSIVPPNDIDNYNDYGEDDDDNWFDCYQTIMEWVKENFNKKPLIDIANEIISETAMTTVANGIYPEVSLWNDNLNFFKQDNQALISFKFHAYQYPKEDTIPYPLLENQEKWKRMIASSNLIPYFNSKNNKKCKIITVSDDLFNFILGLILNEFAQKKYLFNNYSNYLKNNYNKFNEYVYYELAHSAEISRYFTKQEKEELKNYNLLGEILDDNIHVSSNDSRFDNIGMTVEITLTINVNIPEHIIHSVLSRNSQ